MLLWFSGNMDLSRKVGRPELLPEVDMLLSHAKPNIKIE